MKKNFTVFIFFIFSTSGLYAQPKGKLVQVGAGEYLTTYRTDDGRLYVTTLLNDKYQIARVPVDAVMDVDGAQYTNIALDSSGAVFIIGLVNNAKPYAKAVPTDFMGNPFTGNSKVYGWYKTYLTLKEGNVYWWGEDLLKINGSVNADLPLLLQNPPGRKIKKLAPLTLGEFVILALADDGSVWKYQKGSNRPVKVPIPGKARDITGVGSACFVVETLTDLFAWGYLGSYLGVKDLGETPVSIKSKWTAIGCKFPSKELVGNYNTLHIIDAKDDMFGAGENIQGEVGNGKENPDWAASNNPYAWTWGHGQMIQPPVQIPGKFKNLCTSNTITFYFFVQDMGDNWYSWGRNKTRCLGNGITLSINDEAKYPNALGIPAPTLVEPLKVKWKVLKDFKVTDVLPPFAHAGVNQFLNTTYTTLYGSGSFQQKGKVKSYQWSKLEGEGGKIITPNGMNTKVTDLKKGTYVFILTTTNNFNVAAASKVTIHIK